MGHLIGKAIERIRSTQGLSQKEFAERLEVSPAYISALESCRQEPSRMFVKLLSYEFNIRPEWLSTGIGELFIDPVDNHRARNFEPEKPQPNKSTSSNLLVLAAVLCPLLPTAAAALAVGVGAAEIVEKMRRAYKAKNTTDLAVNHLEVDRTYLSHWIRKNHIPSKYIEKAVKDTGLSLEFFLMKEDDIEEGIRKIAKFTKDQILEYDKNKFDLATLENRVRKFMS